MIDRTKLLEEKRKKRNGDLVYRLKNGGYLSINMLIDTFFPPHPKIEKDLKDMQRAYDPDSK